MITALCLLAPIPNLSGRRSNKQRVNMRIYASKCRLGGEVTLAPLQPYVEGDLGSANWIVVRAY